MRKIMRVVLLAAMMAMIASIASAAQISYHFIAIDEYLKTADSVQMVDVRSVQSRSRSGMEVSGEIWIDPYKKDPLDKFIAEQDKNKAYVVYCSCKDDGYSIRTAQILSKNGFKNVSVLKDGSAVIKDNLLPMVKIKGDARK